MLWPTSSIPHSQEHGTNGTSFCEACPEGYALDAIGGTACTPCNFPYCQDATGQPLCKDCNTSCAAGEFHSGCDLLSPGSCKQCPRGQYKTVAGGAPRLACEDCAPGHFTSDLGTATCAPCGVGRWQNESGAPQCKAAAKKKKADKKLEPFPTWDLEFEVPLHISVAVQPATRNRAAKEQHLCMQCM